MVVFRIKKREVQSVQVKHRKNYALSYLGERCVICGSKENLEFDHIEPETKSFKISEYDRPWEEWFAELQKCQILCKSDHRLKTTLERGQIPTVGRHGTISTYNHQKCRCKLCKNAAREYREDLKRRKKEPGG